jgi:hypothetical protein
MVSIGEQSDLIVGIHQSNGFVYKSFGPAGTSKTFNSAAGIEGNFKIYLPEALERNQELKQKTVGHVAAELVGVEVIAAVGGAIGIAREVAKETGMPLLEINTITNKRGKSFCLRKGNRLILDKNPRIGWVEDISCTWQTIDAAARQTRIIDLISVAISCWRRGEPAPEGMTAYEIIEYNKRFNFRHLYEKPLTFPIRSVINRPIPLWIPNKEMIPRWLPELAEAA